MMIKKIAAAAALAAAAVPAFAAINGNTAGTPGELFLSVFDSTAKVSYTKDLAGFDSQASFKTLADDNAGGFSYNWSLAGDANWTNFTQLADLSRSKWMVVSVEKNTSSALFPNGQRIFTTVKQGDEATVATVRNGAINNAVGNMVNFFNAVNTSGTHGVVGTPLDFAVDGSSVNLDSDSGAAYVGEGTTGGLSANFNKNFLFDASNLIGGSAEFVYLTRSSGQNTNLFILVDKFANTAGAANFSFTNGADGAALNYTLAPVPEASTYAMLLAGLLGIGYMARRRQG